MTGNAYPLYTEHERRKVRSAILNATAGKSQWFGLDEIVEAIEKGPGIYGTIHAPTWEAVAEEMDYLTHRTGHFIESEWQSMGPGYSEFESHSQGEMAWKRKNP